MRYLPALAARNYRLFFAGQLFSLVGTWMQQIAMVWLAYRLSDSVVVLGLVGFSSQIPILLFSTLAGVWNDRLDRRRLLLWTQALAMLQALLLFGLAALALVTPGLLVAMAFVLGCINAVDLPARQAFVADLVTDKADLASAIGLNSLLMNGTRFLGPPLAGLLVAGFGEAACFLINACSYLAVIVALSAIRTTRHAVAAQATRAALQAGLRYAFGHAQIRSTLVVVAGFSLCITPYTIMLPVFARDIFAGDASTYGFLVGSAGSGAFVAALYLALRGGRHKSAGLDRLIARAMVAGGAALTAFALLPGLPWSYALLAILGGSVVLSAAGSNTLLQTVVEDAYRGRVMALFSTAFLGVAPLGSLAIGTLGEFFGVRATLCACGILALALGLAYRSHLRQAVTI